MGWRGHLQGVVGEQRGARGTEADAGVAAAALGVLALAGRLVGWCWCKVDWCTMCWCMMSRLNRKMVMWGEVVSWC